MCLFKGFVTVGSAITHNIFPKLLELGHIRIHANDISQQLSWLKVESFRIFDLEFQTLSGGQLIKTEVQCLGEFLAKFLGDKWLLAVSRYFGHQFDNHITKL